MPGMVNGSGVQQKMMVKKLEAKLHPKGKFILMHKPGLLLVELQIIIKQKKAMDSVSKNLLKKNGCLLLSPAYTKPDKMIGYLSDMHREEEKMVEFILMLPPGQFGLIQF